MDGEDTWVWVEGGGGLGVDWVGGFDQGKRWNYKNHESSHSSNSKFVRLFKTFSDWWLFLAPGWKEEGP